MRIEVRLPRHVTQVVRAVLDNLVAVVEGVAFWVAVALPMVYGVGLLVVGIEEIPTWLLVGMIGLNFVALVVGNRHKRPAHGSRAT